MVFLQSPRRGGSDKSSFANIFGEKKGQILMLKKKFGPLAPEFLITDYRAGFTLLRFYNPT